MARRKYLVWRETIYSIYPIFLWVPCAVCGDEFRREKIWVIRNRDLITERERINYACTHCAPTKQKASDLIKKIIFKRPAPPPKPPKWQKRSAR